MATIRPIDVLGEIGESTTLVTFKINPDAPQGPGGFVQAEEYSVNPQVGTLVWEKLGAVTLNGARGGKVGRHCLMGVCAPRSDLKLSAAVSFFRAPGSTLDHLLPNSPFADPNPRRMNLTQCTNELKDADGVLYFYPILASLDTEGNAIGGETFVQGGNYFYTMCVKDIDSGKFFVCDPEMEIDPVN